MCMFSVKSCSPLSRVGSPIGWLRGSCWIVRLCNGSHLATERPLIHSTEWNSQILQSVSNAMYLGVTLTHDLSWSQHVATIVSKAHQRLGLIWHNLRGSPYKCQETAFIALTRSQLEYCSSIWDPILNKDSDSIEKVQSTMNFQWKKRFREMALWACAVARVPGKLCQFA